MKLDHRNTSGAARTVLLVLFAVVGLVVVGVLVAYLVVAWNVNKQFDSEVAKVREMNGGVGYSGVDRMYDLGPQAAARGQAYMDAFAKFPHDTGEGSLVLYFGQTPDVEDELSSDALMQSRAFLESHRASVGELQALAQDTAAVRFPGDAKAWMEGELNHPVALRGAVRLLCLDATLAALDGNGDQAIRSMSAAITMAESIREEPLAISQLVRIACLDLTFRTIEQIVNRSKVSDLQLIRFQGALSQAQPEGLTARGLSGEFSLAFADPPDDPWANLPPEVSHPGFVAKFPPYIRYETVHLVQTFEQLLEIDQLPSFERMDATDAFEQELMAKPDFGNRAAKRDAGMLLRMYNAENRCVALRNAALVALGALRFHSSTGSTRESAAELVPQFLKEIPVDPFTGESTLLRGRGAGFVAYSTGPDKDDDRGMEPGEDENLNLDGDIAFRVVSLPER